ncbi:hypothetical protein HaLaN_21933 [Haematococcus lacustris]|uniref:Uncharacterized protein n=1 Tax=Haematococcus lacustris TaxID=44745 RepID=A0A6A0A050_HAELA|nr:hypothetical protein HaLaN_21933 [Haematococcus lacustris]
MRLHDTQERVLERYFKVGVPRRRHWHTGWVGGQGCAAGLPQGGGEGQQRQVNSQAARQAPIPVRRSWTAASPPGLKAASRSQGLQRSPQPPAGRGEQVAPTRAVQSVCFMPTSIAQPSQGSGGRTLGIGTECLSDAIDNIAPTR